MPAPSALRPDPATYRSASDRPPRRHEAPAAHAPGASSVPYRPDIEGLRAVAVLLVVGYHAGLRVLGGGFVGVDVFFVLSGYLITQILVTQLERTGRTDFVQFYARRARRLLPAASLMLLATLAAELLILSPMEWIEPSMSAVATSLYASNVHFMRGATDYFGAGVEGNPLLHTWSLAVEEQFYLGWPLFVFLGFRITRSRRGLALALAVASAASFAGCLWLTRRNQPLAFFLTPARAWEFGVGGLASLAVLPAAVRRRRVPLGWAGVAMVGVAGVWTASGGAFPGVLALLPVLGTTLALLAGAAGRTPVGVGRLLAARPMQWLGTRSYSWYLWHWPALSLALVVAPKLPTTGRVLVALAALVVAAATHALVENPIRFNRTLAARPALTIAGGVLLSVAAAGLSWGVHRSAVARGGAHWAAAHDMPTMVNGGCAADFRDATPRMCTFGDTASRETVVLLGDSHAVQWFPALERVARARHWKLVTMVKYSCPLARVLTYNRVLRRPYEECMTWREEALAQVVALHPAAVVIGQYDRSRGLHLDAGGATRSNTVDEWAAAFRSSLASLDSAGVPTIVLRDTPTVDVVVPKCVARAEYRGRALAECATPRARAVDAAAYRVWQRAAAGLRHVAFVDLLDRICGGTTCEPLRDGMVAYRDRNHISTQFSRHLAPDLEARLVPALAAVAR